MMATTFFSSPWISVIGWTLLHSLWQGLLCLIVAVVLLRLIPSRMSEVRYGVVTASLFFIFFLSVVTLIYLRNSSPVAVDTQKNTIAFFAGLKTNPIVPYNENTISGTLTTALSAIQNSLPVIVLVWSIGSLLFSIRLFVGWLTLRNLRTSATLVDGDWNLRANALANKLGINQLISIGESVVTQAPVVIGYFKPIILIPVGMLAGLSTDQVESIIIHELIHIRRGDYFVNLLQTLLESLLFFNPFVWIISGIVRREREHCCDDGVIKEQGNAMAYARALTALEEARLSRVGLALSLAENKHQLLNRIKRIMEKSSTSYSFRERMIPAILLITGLICASWLTVQSGKQKEDSTVFSQDTTIRIEKSGRYYKKTITTIDEDGKPHEQVVEQFDGDDDLSEVMEPMNFNFDFAIPAIPSIEAIEAIAAIPPIPDFNFDFHLRMDTIPNVLFGPGFHGNWDDFGREFEVDFLAKNGEEINEMIEELQSRFENQEMNLEELQSLNDELAEMKHEEFLALQEQQLQNLEENMEQWNQENEMHLEQLDNNLKQLDAQLKQIDCNTYFRRINAKMDSAMMPITHFRVRSAKMIDLEADYTSLQKELREELVRDGYLEKDEKINSIEIGDNMNTIKINDKQIKEKDLPKYKAIFDKHAIGRLDRNNFPPDHSGRRKE